MRRFLLVASLLVISATASPQIPTGIEPMNRFSNEYNRYVSRLQGGVVDVKQWARVESAWKALR